MNISGLIKQLLGDPCDQRDGSVAVTDQRLVRKFVSDPDFPFLVSFPRTGSHWLRMLMELYFKRPSLVRVFYYPDRRDYLTLHTHDLDLDVRRRNVLYLYRNPAPTVYSLMRYHGEVLGDSERVKYWSSLYGRHLKKWLLDEKPQMKTIIRYENLQATPFAEFGKITAHFGQVLDKRKLKEVLQRVTKASVREKTLHDIQVINTDSGYENKRRHFYKRHGKQIESNILSVCDSLEPYYEMMKSKDVTV